MLEAYDDIRKRIAEPPIWFDQNGVPRYDPHSPKLCPNIYVNEVVLLEIECQDCRTRFLVQMYSGKWTFRNGELTHRTFKPVERLLNIHYGDPPWHDGCAGDTMNCHDLRVVEFWERVSGDWTRCPELEIGVE